MYHFVTTHLVTRLRNALEERVGENSPHLQILLQETDLCEDQEIL